MFTWVVAADLKAWWAAGDVLLDVGQRSVHNPNANGGFLAPPHPGVNNTAVGQVLAAQGIAALLREGHATALLGRTATRWLLQRLRRLLLLLQRLCSRRRLTSAGCGGGGGGGQRIHAEAAGQKAQPEADSVLCGDVLLPGPKVFKVDVLRGCRGKKRGGYEGQQEHPGHFVDYIGIPESLNLKFSIKHKNLPVLIFHHMYRLSNQRYSIGMCTSYFDLL